MLSSPGFWPPNCAERRQRHASPPQFPPAPAPSSGWERSRAELEHFRFSPNRFNALSPCFVACPNRKTVSTFAGHALGNIFSGAGQVAGLRVKPEDDEVDGEELT